MKNESLFCPLAATQIEIDTDGNLRPCCNFQGSFGNVKTSSNDEVFRSELAKSLRENLKNGLKDTRCNFCWSLEEKNIISKRQQSFDMFHSNEILLDQTEPTLRSLDLKQSNLCNLKCRTCTPFSSTNLKEEFQDFHLKKFGARDVSLELKMKEAEARWFNEDFWTHQKNNLTSVRKIDFYGGEPLLDPYHKAFLKESLDLK